MLSAVLCIIVRQYKPEMALGISIACGVLIMGAVIAMLAPSVELISQLTGAAGLQGRGGIRHRREDRISRKSRGSCDLPAGVLGACGDSNRASWVKPERDEKGRKMRRILLTLAKLLAVIAAAFLLCGSARAEGSGEYGDINSALSDAVPPEASEILEGGGITPDNNGAAALSFGGVLEFLRDMLMDRLTEPLRLFASLCGVVILCALSRSSADGAGGNMSGVFSAVGVLAGAGMTTAAISGALRDTLDVLSAASEFMLVFVPVFAGVIAAMGKAAAASAANTVILAAAQFFSQISVNFLTPVCGTVMGLSVTGAVHPEMSTDKLGELIRKAAVWGLSLLMTVFMSVLSAQTFVTNSADNVLIRTAKFAVSSGVPIVGGTISDAVNTVHASLSLMHSSIGTYGIAAGIVILLPSLISVVCYRFALTAAEAVSEVFGVKELSTLFRACGAVMSIIMAVIVCFLLLNTISAVIMLAAGSSQA